MQINCGGVSKVISSLAEDIEEKENKEEQKSKYKIQIASSNATKNKSEISGDTSIQTKLHDGKYMMALSDGMGSGPRAQKSSSTVIKMLKRLLTTGFDKDISIGLINSSVNLNSNEETYATIDISVIDTYEGNIEFIKNGACPTFIKTKNKVEVVKAISLPAGIVENIDLVVYDKDLKGGEIIVMCSDRNIRIKPRTCKQGNLGKRIIRKYRNRRYTKNCKYFTSRIYR